jgi:hypothetical protein
VTRLRWILVGLVAALLLAFASQFAVGGSSDSGVGATTQAQATGLAGCAELGEDEIRDCYAAALKEIVESADDPLAAVDEITRAAREDPGGFLLPNCHGLMHTVGREYARDHNLTVAALKDSLPRSNDPGCPAGYAHGLVTGVAPLIDPRNPKASAAVCDDAGTRYERYSCTHGFGHAFMRITNEDLPAALALCTKLGPNAGPDCAQGAFHDYWFSVAGYDDTKKPGDIETDPQKLCGEQAPKYVRQCWYRAFVDNRPPGSIESATDVQQLCQGLEGLQREGCITAATVIGPADPRIQFAICYGFTGNEALACVRGLKLQNLIGASNELYASVLDRCGALQEAVRLDCYRWLGKTAAVLTDGKFETTGCRLIELKDARKACVEGARTMDEPLVTFS